MVSLFLAIALNAILNTSDTASDIGMFKLLWSRKFENLAIILLGIDFLPGLLVNIHHITSSTWRTISTRKKIISVSLLVIQPFSVILTSCAWMSHIDNDYYHYLSRLSTVIHGHLESPLQFVFFFYLWSKGYIRTPLEETSVFVDRNGNSLPLGNIAGTFSLSFTISGMVKGALDSFESYDSKFKFLCFSSTNMVFRIFSLCFFTQYFDNIVYISFLIVPIIIINSVLFSRRAGYHGKGISIISSLVCSIIVPVSTTEKPHLYQITLESLSEIKRKSEKENRKKLSDETRRNSAILCFCTSPIFLLADAAVAIVANYGSYVNDSVWTNRQLTSWFFCFFIPTFFMVILTAVSIYKNEEKSLPKQKETSKTSNKYVRIIRNIPRLLKSHAKENYYSDIAILGMIVIIAAHSSNVPRTNSYLIGYEHSEKRELSMFEARSSFDLKKLCKENLCNLKDFSIQIKNMDYRNVSHMEDNTIYIKVDINVTTIPKTIRIIEDAADWEDIASNNDEEKLCKRCLPGPNPQHQRCLTLSFEGWKINDCKGRISFLLKQF